MSEQTRQTFRGVEVLLSGRLTPLVATAPRLSSQKVNWEGLALEAHSTPPCDHAYHEHPTHFLQLQLKGPARYEWTTAGRIHVATAHQGTIFVCPRGSYDRVQWTSPTERIALAIHPHLLTQALEESAHLEDVELPQHFALRDRHIESLILALRSDLEDGSVAGPLYGESIATALAVYLQKRYGVTRPRTFQLRGGLPTIRLKRVLEYIRANIGADLRLSNLATIAGMSPHYFCELFKQSTGLSPHQYVLRARVECAKGHLDHGPMSIIEASAVSGFTDQSYFTKVFRRVVGVTPTQYRAGLFHRARKTTTGEHTAAGFLWVGSDLVGDAQMLDEKYMKETTAHDEVAREGPKADAVGHDSVGNAGSEREARHDASVQGIRERVDGFLRSEKLHDASRLILDSVLKPTQSAFGFVGLLLEGGLLRLLIHDGFSWHPTTNRAFYEEKMRAYGEDGYLDFHESDNLIAAVVKEKSVVLTNSPGPDPRSKGVPAGHPPLRCFLGVPALKEQDVVGMIGLANRPNGYAASDQAMVEPLMPSVVSLYETYCRLQRNGRLKMSLTSGQ